MLVEYDVVKYCSIECRLQMSGELSVGWMIDGMIYAQEMSKCPDTVGNEGQVYRNSLPTVNDVLALGKLVEPIENAQGFRRCGVRVGWDEKMDWQEVPRQMVILMEALREPPVSYPDKGISVPVLTPDTFFKEYEEIHPFRDGNGRTGAILFNWLNGTLDHPVWPSNWFNDPRRTVGYGA